MLILASSVSTPARKPPAQSQKHTQAGAAWSEFEQGMETMHVGMHSIKPSGNDDLDFVRLMLPHHQAAIDMARVELAHGKDPQLRRLAEEIVTDQQSEIEVLRLWLKEREARPPN